MERDAVYEDLRAMKNRLVELASELETAGEYGAAGSLDEAYERIREAQAAILEGWAE